MRKERKNRFRAYTNELKLGIGQNLERKKDFVKKKGLDREKTKRYQGVWDRMKSDDPWVYIDSDISTDRDDIEKVSRTKSQ